MFDDLELNPTWLGLAVLGGFASLVMAAKMSTGIFMKIIIFLATTALCYFVVGYIANK